MLAVAMLALGMGLGALIAAALYATELKRIATFLRTRNKHSNARVTAGTPAPGIHELASVINDGLEETSRERIEALRSQEEFQRDLSALSHDIRTPLTGAKGYLQLALDETDDDVRTHHLDAAAARIDSTTELLDALFAYTKSTDPDLLLTPEVVEVEAAIERALLAHYPEFEARGWEPRISCAEGTTILADRDALARIFDNLIVNALRHGADAPRVSVRSQDGVARIEFANAVAPGTQIDADRLFDRFYQADSARNSSGSGLGLAIAANLAHAMGMEISARIEKGEGGASDDLVISLASRNR
ncbi:sensor histidine kinase [Enorma sp.]|uniref:sensor histidine kinase n=1 Tax=Enorma sp. TaxID=1920692 RepID=UPI003AB46FC1